MLQRILVAVVGIPALLFILCWLPHWATAALLAALCVVGAHELLSAACVADSFSSVAEVAAVVMLVGRVAVVALLLYLPYEAASVGALVALVALGMVDTWLLSSEDLPQPVAAIAITVAITAAISTKIVFFMGKTLLFAFLTRYY